jgi:LCP family protein required for cell wall assembly
MKRKRRNQDIGSELPNMPRRQSRRILGDTQGFNKGINSDNEARLIGDFNRTSGYHSIRPTITRNAQEDLHPKLQLDKKESLLGKNLAISDNQEPTDKPARKDRKKRRLTLKILYVPLFAGVVIGIFLFSKGIINLNKIFGGNSSSIQASQSVSALKKEGDGRINILVLGIGGAGHDGPDLTDTILLVSIDPVNHQAGLLSIPRDLWVTPEGYQPMKLNAVYENGKWSYTGGSSSNDKKAIQAGFNLENKVVGGILGIPIQNDIVVDFKAFQEAVDTLGGVNVNVPTELYDPTIAWQNNNNPVIAMPGDQTFNGAKALLYVRSRETTSDFARANRQRAVLLAMKDKVFSLGTFSNPSKISSLSDELGNNVDTSLSLNDVATLYSIMKQINNSQIKSIDLAEPPNNYVTTDELDGQSVVRPIQGYGQYSNIQNFVRNTLKDSYLQKENSGVLIVNAGSNAGLGSSLGASLSSYGYRVLGVQNSSQKIANSSLVDMTNGKDKYTNHYLQLRLGLSSTQTLPDSIQSNGANFVIILGEDEAITIKN